MNDTDVVSAIRSILVEKLGAERCELWFGATTRLTLSDEKLLIEAGTKFAQDWLRTHYRGQLEAAASAALGKAAAIEFRVDAALDVKKQPRNSSSGGKGNRPQQSGSHSNTAAA